MTKHKKSIYKKLISSTTVFFLAVLMGVAWFVHGFTSYGHGFTGNLPKNLIPWIHAILFFNTLAGLFMSLIMRVEESINSETSKENL